MASLGTIKKQGHSSLAEAKPPQLSRATVARSSSITLKNDDCLQFLSKLEAGSVDIITTDPAYSGMNNMLKLGKGRIVGRYTDKGLKDGKWFAEFADTVENYELFLRECKRVLKPTGHIYIMFDSYSLLSLGPLIRDTFKLKNIITWDKVNMGMGHYYRRRHEFIIFATNGNNRKINAKSFPDVWRLKRIHRAKYPTQKPTEIFEIMLSASAEPGFTVCDPFMGSGSAAIAAIKYACDFIGCDVSAEAISMSKSRINTYLASGIDELQPSSAVPTDERIFW